MSDLETHTLERWCCYIPNVGYVKFQSNHRSVIDSYPHPRGLYMTKAILETILERKISEAQKTQRRYCETFRTGSHGHQWLSTVEIRKVFVTLQVEPNSE